MPESHLCCGSAGTYNILQPDIASRLRDRKVANIATVKPDMIAAGNIDAWFRLPAVRRSCGYDCFSIGRQEAPARIELIDRPSSVIRQDLPRISTAAGHQSSEKIMQGPRVEREDAS
jgi:hypothetical protein